MIIRSMAPLACVFLLACSSYKIRPMATLPAAIPASDTLTIQHDYQPPHGIVGSGRLCLHPITMISFLFIIPSYCTVKHSVISKDARIGEGSVSIAGSWLAILYAPHPDWTLTSWSSLWSEVDEEMG